MRIDSGCFAENADRIGKPNATHFAVARSANNVKFGNTVLFNGNIMSLRISASEYTAGRCARKDIGAAIISAGDCRVSAYREGI